jgi:hypothetical protein
MTVAIQIWSMLRIAELLIHSDDVPAAARTALVTAYSGPQTDRFDNLIEAARILHRDIGLDCEDARELVGLDASACSCD